MSDLAEAVEVSLVCFAVFHCKLKVVCLVDVLGLPGVEVNLSWCEDCVDGTDLTTAAINVVWPDEMDCVDGTDLPAAAIDVVWPDEMDRVDGTDLLENGIDVM